MNTAPVLISTKAIRARKHPPSLMIIGQPIAHSLSPAMQAAALEAAGFVVRYDRREVAPGALVETLEEFRRSQVGGNVTMPHKEAVYAIAERVSPLAARIGSVNTFWFEDALLCGHNTDVAGSLATIRKLCPQELVGRSAALIGAGGSAAALLVALDLAGCTDIRVWTRTPDRARLLADRVGVPVQLAFTAESAVDGVALVINASPLGMRDDAMPVDPSLVGTGTAVFDLVYRAGGTAWVRACRERGLHAEDGLRMLVEQGAEAFRVWFDVEPSLDAMWSALEQRPWMQP